MNCSCGSSRTMWTMLTMAGVIVGAYAVGALCPACGWRSGPDRTPAGGGAATQPAEAPGAIAALTGKTFGAATASGVVLVDFWAPWCQPCRAQAPILEALATTLPQGARIAKVNVDDNQALADRFGVEGIPTLLLLKNGKELRRFVGVQQADRLRQAIREAM